MSASRVLGWLERTLIFVGCTCIGYYGYSALEARQFQREQTSQFEALLAAPSPDRVPAVAASGPAAPASPVASPTVASTSGTSTSVASKNAVASSLPSARGSKAESEALELTVGMIGVLDIPRLGISSAVMSGDDAETLDLAVGHLPDTPKPWEPGNSAVAAHRDGLFRPLKHIRVGDEIRVRTLYGKFTYLVRELKIVTPDDLSVLASTPTETLTLITCYPFNFVGSAPKRFIVRAERVPVQTTH